MRHFLFLALATSAALSFSDPLFAESLKKAEVTQIINQVGILNPGSGERPAAVNDVVEGKLGVRTGQKSRAELVFADRTLTRLGANTIFNFEDGTRNMDLSQGTILLQVPKNSGGATIKTAAVTAAVTGTTILFEHTPAPEVPEHLKQSEALRNRKPHGYIKAMVLEGELKVWLKGNLGESIILKPGQMLIMADDATEIPEPVDFDIETVVATSKLIDRAVWLQRTRELDLNLIRDAIAEQQNKKASGDLIETNLFINGRGTKVVMGDDQPRENERDSQQFARVQTPTPISTPDQTPDSSPTPIVTPTPTPIVTPTPTPTPIVTPTPGDTPTPSPSPTDTASPTPNISPTPDSDPDPTPHSDPDPTPDNDLRTFTSQGATNTIDSESNANYDPNLPGNVRIVNSLPNNFEGGIDVLPTDGDSFAVISNGGTIPGPSPEPSATPLQNYTGTQVVTNFGQQSESTTKSFVEMDYRALTNESTGEGGQNDRIIFNISGVNGMRVTYVISRNQLLNSDGPTAIARNYVGSYFTGTDWLTLKLELTPFLQAGESSFSISVEDLNDNTVDTAVAIDRYGVTNDPTVPENGNLHGFYTAIFPNGVTFGNGSGEYQAPSLQGVENLQTYGPGSDGGSFVARTDIGDLVVNTPILADTGINKPEPFQAAAVQPPATGGSAYTGGEGGSVELTSTQASVVVNSTIQVSANDVEANRVSASGGAINVASERSGEENGVVINNTGELLSLLNASAPGPGGRITIRAGDSNVLVNGGKVIATRGEVDIRAPGENRRITLNNAEIRGDVVKIGALGNGGQLIIGGGTISADTTLKLYGNSSNGAVTFVADTTLSGDNAEKIISAHTVTVQDRVQVQVNGPAATVYTTNPNYTGSGGNGTTTGSFTGSGATTAPTPPPFD